MGAALAAPRLRAPTAAPDAARVRLLRAPGSVRGWELQRSAGQGRGSRSGAERAALALPGGNRRPRGLAAGSAAEPGSAGGCGGAVGRSTATVRVGAPGLLGLVKGTATPRL